MRAAARAFLLAAVALAAVAAEPPPPAPRLVEGGFLQLTVVDEHGAPVPDATVQPGLCLSTRMGLAWTGPDPDHQDPHPSLATDLQGRVSLFFPRFLLGTQVDQPTVSVEVSVTKPGYAEFHRLLKVKENPYRVGLSRGTTLTLQAKLPDGTLARAVYAELNDRDLSLGGIRWKCSEDGRTVTSAFALPPGEIYVRAVVLAADGTHWFSRATPVASTAEVPALTLPLEVVPGRDVKGVLADVVPRPVTGGVVIAYVPAETREPGAHGKSFGPEWKTHATIAADGSFTLQGLPPGPVCLTALCSGWCSGPLPERSATVEPLPFPPETAEPLVIAMTPTGSARLKVLSPTGQPVAGATVAYFPRQKPDSVSTSPLGATSDTETQLLWTHGRGEPPRPNAPMAHTIRTGADGQAVFTNLPALKTQFYVSGAGRGSAVMQVIPGQETTAEITASP